MFALRALAVCALAAVSSALALPEGRWKAIEIPILSPEPAIYRVDATKPPLITISGADGRSCSHAGRRHHVRRADNKCDAVFFFSAHRRGGLGKEGAGQERLDALSQPGQ